MGSLVNLNNAQLSLVKKTIARDCNAEEFDLFMAAAQSYGLDPFRKQIVPVVFSKNNAERRNMSIIVSRDGLRVIASRCGDYRPASERAEIITQDELKSPTNPKGILSATVRLSKQDKNGDWFPVIGEAYWDEFVPLTAVWAENENGKRRPTGEEHLDPKSNWFKMSIIMITKCAEAQALRAGWPEQFSGVYSEDEIDRSKAIDATASELVEREEEELRQRRIGGADAITVWWGDGYALENVPLGQFADRALEHAHDCTSDELNRWQDMNMDGLRKFWAKQPADALELKKALEKLFAELKANEVTTEKDMEAA